MKLRFTAPARRDIDAILADLRTKSPQGAANVNRRIRGVAAKLAEQPRMGKQTSNPRLRRLVVHPYPYVLFYEVTATTVLVTSVLHGARDPGAMPGAEGGG